MHLRLFLNSASRGTAVAIAKSVGVSPVMVTQWASGVKVVPPERCLPIELATKGAVTRADLRPNDYWLIWPDLKPPRGARAKAVA